MQQGIKVDILNNVLFSNNEFQLSLEIDLNIQKVFNCYTLDKNSLSSKCMPFRNSHKNITHNLKSKQNVNNF